ncbi:MAG: hypothetical protein WC101_05430 [Candidatus Gracilibacteria bacterium]
MNRKFYIAVSTLAVVVVAAVALGAQGRLFKGDWGGRGAPPLSSPVSATKPLSVPAAKMVTPPGWSDVKLTKAQVVKASASGQTVVSPEVLPFNDLPAGNQQPWIKRVQFAHLMEKTLGVSPKITAPFLAGCPQVVVDYKTPRLFGAGSPTDVQGIICFVVMKGIMPTLSAPVKNSFYGGQNISRVVAAGMLQRAFDPLAESQKPQSWYVDFMNGPDCSNGYTICNPIYTDISPYMWSVYWLAAVDATDVEPWVGNQFRPYDSLTIPEAMTWLKAVYNKLPKSGWIK